MLVKAKLNIGTRDLPGGLAAGQEADIPDHVAARLVLTGCAVRVVKEQPAKQQKAEAEVAHEPEAVQEPEMARPLGARANAPIAEVTTEKKKSPTTRG